MPQCLYHLVQQVRQVVLKVEVQVHLKVDRLQLALVLQFHYHQVQVLAQVARIVQAQVQVLHFLI